VETLYAVNSGSLFSFSRTDTALQRIGRPTGL
jgi:hypothetical protein